MKPVDEAIAATLQQYNMLEAGEKQFVNYGLLLGVVAFTINLAYYANRKILKRKQYLKEVEAEASEELMPKVGFDASSFKSLITSNTRNLVAHSKYADAKKQTPSPLMVLEKKRVVHVERENKALVERLSYLEKRINHLQEDHRKKVLESIKSTEVHQQQTKDVIIPLTETPTPQDSLPRKETALDDGVSSQLKRRRQLGWGVDSGENQAKTRVLEAGVWQIPSNKLEKEVHKPYICVNPKADTPQPIVDKPKTKEKVIRPTYQEQTPTLILAGVNMVAEMDFINSLTYPDLLKIQKSVGFIYLPDSIYCEALNMLEQKGLEATTLKDLNLVKDIAAKDTNKLDYREVMNLTRTDIMQLRKDGEITVDDNALNRLLGIPIFRNFVKYTPTETQTSYESISCALDLDAIIITDSPNIHRICDENHIVCWTLQEWRTKTPEVAM